MFRSIVIAATAASFAVVAVPVPTSAQTVLQGVSTACNPATGLGPNGRPCKGLVRLSNDRINAGERIANVPALDRSQLAEVYDCRDLDELGGVVAGQVEQLVQDCGTPAPPATLTNFKPYAGELVAATPPPPPPPAALPPAPAPLPPAPIAAAPPVYAPVQAAGLGGSIVPLALGAAGLAAVIGIAVAIGDDDDDSSNSTTGTTGTN